MPIRLPTFSEFIGCLKASSANDDVVRLANNIRARQGVPYQAQKYEDVIVGYRFGRVRGSFSSMETYPRRNAVPEFETRSRAIRLFLANHVKGNDYHLSLARRWLQRRVAIM